MADDNSPSRLHHNTDPPPAWAPLGSNTGGNLSTSTYRLGVRRRAVGDTVTVPSRLFHNPSPRGPLAQSVVDAFGSHVERIAALSPQVPATQEEVSDNDMSEGKPTKANVNIPPMDFSPADKKLLDFGMHSDAKVVANGKVYEVHKSVLCTRSKWFRAALESGFMEGNSSVVNISAADNIDQLLEFLYTGAVDLSMLDETQVMAAANELAVLGDFYQVDELKTYAEQVLGQYLGAHLTAISAANGSALLPRQYRHIRQPEQDWNYCPDNYKIMKEAGFVDRLCAEIRDAYAKQSGIHRVYVAFVCAARKCTFKCQLIRDFKEEVPEFAHDLLNAMMDGLDCAAFEGNAAFEKWKDTLSAEPRERFCAGCAQHGRRVRYYQDI